MWSGLEWMLCLQLNAPRGFFVRGFNLFVINDRVNTFPFVADNGKLQCFLKNSEEESESVTIGKGREI